MSSIQSKFFLFLLKHRNLFKFQFERKNEITWNTSIPELRQKTEKAGRMFGKLPKDITITTININERYAEWVIPNLAPSDKVILYFHGGGYVIGSAQGHRPHVAKITKASGIRALVFDYRLAPEHPFPAALDDALSAYNFLLAQGFKSKNIVLMGDSAGGGLCLSSLIAIRDQNLPLPSAAIALSPWTDLSNTGASLITNQKVDVLTWKESWTIFSSYYVGKENPAHPWISPLYANLTGLPSLLIYAGADELLRDDSTRFAEKARKSGVDVRLMVEEGMFHCYPICSPLFPEAKRAMDQIAAFIKSHLK